MPRNLLLALACTLALSAAAQPMWRFPIAFEDGTGARDTIWLVYDTTATIGSNSFPTVDYTLGEGHVDMNFSEFNVWVPNWDNDSTKTVAFPYTEFPYHDATVQAFNFQYPVTIRWDLSIGSEPWLPQNNGPINFGMIYNQYFYYFNNCGGPPCGVFDMSLADSVVVPQPDPNFLFPVGFTLVHSSSTGLDNLHGGQGIAISPNPAKDRIWITGLKDDECTVRIQDVMGRVVLKAEHVQPRGSIALTRLSPGLYICQLFPVAGGTHVERLVVE